MVFPAVTAETFMRLSVIFDSQFKANQQLLTPGVKLLQPNAAKTIELPLKVSASKKEKHWLKIDTPLNLSAIGYGILGKYVLKNLWLR